MKKRENIIMIVGLLLLIVAVLGVSYAAFSYTGAGSKINTITTGVLSMSYTESDNVISMDKALPTTDATGTTRLRDGEYFDFTVESTITGSAIINYEVAAEALSSNTFEGKNVKLYLTKINGTTEEEIMSPKLYIPIIAINNKTGRPAGMVSLTTGTIGVSETIKYRLRMYVKENYNPQDDNGNEVFEVKINVYGKIDEAPTGTMIKAFSDSDFHATEYSNKTTSIVTKDNNEIPSSAIASWDISEKGDGKAVAYYEDDGTGDGTYKLTLGGEGGLVGNPNMSYYFAGYRYVAGISAYYFNELTSIDLTYLDTSKVTNMDSMFYFCRGLTPLNLSNFDTSSVTNMSRMFVNCISLTLLNLTSFDTSKVTRMDEVFSGCSSLTSLDVSNFDTSKVTNMDSMFSQCSSLTSLNVTNFDTSKVTNMDSMFSQCSSLTSLNVTNFDTSIVKNMFAMFSSCSSLTSLDVSNFDTSKVTNMQTMFYSCSNLTSLNLNNFDTSIVKNMCYMFSYCSGLTSIDISSFDTSSVTNMSLMFDGCSSLTLLDVSSFDTSKVTKMYGMFSNSTKLTTIEVSSKWVIGSITDVTNMFNGCGTDHVTYI